MSLKIKRLFWGIVVLCVFVFIIIVGIEMYIKNTISNRILRLDPYAKVEFSGNISLKDLSYNASDINIDSVKIKVQAKSFKYAFLSGDITVNHITIVTPVDKSLEIKSDVINVRKLKNTDITDFTFKNLTSNSKKDGSIKINVPILQISKDGTLKVQFNTIYDVNDVKTKILFSANDLEYNKSELKFSLDNTYYNVSSDISMNSDFKNIASSIHGSKLMSLYRDINYIKFHISNKNIAGLNIRELNSNYIYEELTKMKAYDTKYNSTVRKIIDNFFNKKQDIYGYFHTQSILKVPSIVLSNEKLPKDKHSLDNFIMSVSTPVNVDPQEQEKNGDKPLIAKKKSDNKKSSSSKEKDSK